MSRSFDLKLVNLTKNKKGGQIVASNPTGFFGVRYSTISHGLVNEDEVDKVINSIIARLEDLRTAAKRELIESDIQL